MRTMSRVEDLTAEVLADLRTASGSEPLLVEIWGMPPDEAALLVKCVADQSRNNVLDLHTINFDHIVGEALSSAGILPPCLYQGVHLQPDDGAGAWLAFFRQEPHTPQE